MSDICSTCCAHPCICCHDEAPVMQLATYPPIESNEELEAGAGCPDWRFYDQITEEFVVPDPEAGGTVLLHVCNSLEYFVGMYVSIFDGVTYVGLFKVTDLPSETTVRVLNTGVDDNQPAGYIAAVGSYVIVAQPPTYLGEVTIEAGAICTTEIGNLCVTRPKLANDAVDQTKLADDAVRQEHILDQEVLANHLGFLPFVSNITQVDYNGSYVDPIPLLPNRQLHATLSITKDAWEGDTFLCLFLGNMFSPHAYLNLLVTASTIAHDEFTNIVHVNDTSASDYTPVTMYSLVKVTGTGTGTITFEPRTQLGAVAGTLGRCWFTVVRLRSYPNAI